MGESARFSKEPCQAQDEHQQRPAQGCQWAATTANLTEKNADGCRASTNWMLGRDQQQSNADDPCNQAHGTPLPFHQGPIGLQAGEGLEGSGSLLRRFDNTLPIGA